MARAARLIIISTCLALLLATSEAAAQQPLRLAVAANFIRPMEAIAALYQAQTGTKVEISYGSSGKLYAQIRQGAPYDLFLSADMERPEKLAAEGLCLAPFQYATGQVVLWSAKAGSKATTWQEALQGKERIALANPATAPYGRVAAQALSSAGLLPTAEKRLVYGQSVAQAFQFSASGGTPFGFIALSHALSPRGQAGRYWQVPEAGPVHQGGCQLTTSPQKDETRHFIEFLASDRITGLKRDFGYQP